MNDTSKELLQHKLSMKQVGVLSLLIVLAAQVNLDVFTNNYLDVSNICISVWRNTAHTDHLTIRSRCVFIPYLDLWDSIRIPYRKCMQSFS